MRTFELIYRVVHIPTFRAEYEQYWDQPRSVATSFSIKLGLILTVGIVFDVENQEKQLRRSSRAWIQAAQYWLVGPSEKSTSNMNGVQIFCLFLVARQITSLGRSPWLSESSLLKVAMTMGLHQDPKRFRLPPFEAEIRTRLWTTVLELIVHGTMDSLTPLLLSPLDFEDHHPQNISDAELGPDSRQLPSQQPLSSFTQPSIPILMRQSLYTRIEVTRLVQNGRGEQSYEKAIELAAELQKACRTLATYCRLHWSQSLTMHYDFLDMQLRRYILILHRPFMLQAQDDPRFHLSQKICRESAVILASYAERMSLPSDVLDDLSRLMIMSTGSFRGPFGLDVITVLALEVISQIEETSADPSSSSSHTLGGGIVLDPLAELARTQREPIIRSMEHIKEQLLQIIKLGHPTLKRYIFLAGVLSQIHATDLGQNAQAAVMNTVRETLKECYAILQSFRTADMPPGLLAGLNDDDLLASLNFDEMVSPA